jgi:hypothetical protein
MNPPCELAPLFVRNTVITLEFFSVAHIAKVPFKGQFKSVVYTRHLAVAGLFVLCVRKLKRFFKVRRVVSPMQQANLSFNLELSN